MTRGQTMRRLQPLRTTLRLYAPRRRRIIDDLTGDWLRLDWIEGPSVRSMSPALPLAVRGSVDSRYRRAGRPQPGEVGRALAPENHRGAQASQQPTGTMYTRCVDASQRRRCSGRCFDILYSHLSMRPIATCPAWPPSTAAHYCRTSLGSCRRGRPAARGHPRRACPRLWPRPRWPGSPRASGWSCSRRTRP